MDPFQLGFLYDYVILSLSLDTELRVTVRYVCAHGGVQTYAYTATPDDIKSGIVMNSMPDALQWILQKIIFINIKAVKPGKGIATCWFYHVT